MCSTWLPTVFGLIPSWWAIPLLGRLGPAEDPLHVVDVHPHPFAVAAGERTGLVPDRAGDAEASDVVDEGGPSGERRIGGWHVQQGGGGGDQLRGAATVAGEVGAAQV